MATKCAVCGEPLTYFQSDQKYCTDCKTISCPRCRHFDTSDCLYCGSEKKSKRYEATVFALVFGTLFVAALLGSLTWSDLNRTYALDSMPVTHIQDARPGDHVKIEGTLAGNTTIVLDGHYNASLGTFRFDRKTVNLTEGNPPQTLILNLSFSTSIQDGPHRSASGNDEGSSYHSGDRVLAIGTVRVNETGRNFLQTEILAPAGTTFFPPHICVPLAAVLIFPAGGVIIGIYWLFLRMRNDRIIAANGGKFKIARPEPYRPITSTGEIRNDYINLNMKISRIFLSVLAIVALSILAVALISFQTFQNNIAADLVAFFVLFCPALFLVISYHEYLTTPHMVGVDATGYWLTFHNGRTIGSRWADINEIFRPAIKEKKTKPASSEAVYVGYTNGQIEVFGPVTPAIADTIDKTQKAHPQPEEEEPPFADTILVVLKEKLKKTEDPEKRSRIEALIREGEEIVRKRGGG